MVNFSSYAMMFPRTLTVWMCSEFNHVRDNCTGVWNNATAIGDSESCSNGDEFWCRFLCDFRTDAQCPLAANTHTM